MSTQLEQARASVATPAMQAAAGAERESVETVMAEVASGRAVLPVITGRAHVTAEGALLLDPADAFAWGIP